MERVNDERVTVTVTDDYVRAVDTELDQMTTQHRAMPCDRRRMDDVWVIRLMAFAPVLAVYVRQFVNVDDVAY